MSTTENETGAGATTENDTAAAMAVSEKAMEILLDRARQMQQGMVRAAYGAYRVHDRSK
jgi:hypothetical protein